MKSLTIDEIKRLDFKISDESPIIKPFNGSLLVADPSVLTPDKAPDRKWHIFFHTTFGIYRSESIDGVHFNKAEKITNRAMRPNINLINNKYYLFFERTRPLIMNGLNIIGLAKWKSEIYCIKSKDLKNWSSPEKVIAHTREYEEDTHGISISNPYLIEIDGKYRMYYSCGLTFVKDCGFCEPTYISYAESNRIGGEYISAEKPIISPDRNKFYINLCSGCLKVYELKDGYMGIQNGIYEKDGKSHSGIVLLTSKDGIDFEFEKILIEPKMHINGDWMNQFVYASHLVKYGNSLRLYFNARNKADILKGRECIGFAEAEINAE